MCSAALVMRIAYVSLADTTLSQDPFYAAAGNTDIPVLISKVIYSDFLLFGTFCVLFILIAHSITNFVFPLYDKVNVESWPLRCELAVTYYLYLLLILVPLEYL